jgi:tRNA(Ile)-lysidine synthase
MGATRTPRSPDPLWRSTLAALPVGSPARPHGWVPEGRIRRWAVACSGGRDSVALLHAASELARDLCTQGQPAEVLALHVHHGLSAHADHWLDHVHSLCAQWAASGAPVRCVAQRVAVSCQTGQSLEAEARRLRHGALHNMALAEGVTEVWLAHHQRDQAETFLVQALRGAGVKGLAAMPAAQCRKGLNWVRPWLALPAQDLASYVARQGLSHIEDDSNADTRWARNRLRHAVWPNLRTQFEQVDASLADAARHVADVLPVLDAWAQRPPNERRLLLARWYRERSGRALSAAWVERLADEWPGLLADQRPWRDAGLGLQVYRGVLSWTPPHARPAVAAWPGEGAVDVSLSVATPGAYPLPNWGGVLWVAQADEGGLPAPSAGVACQWLARSRMGGERWQAHEVGPPRSLKKQFQSAAVPPWARQGPLLFSGGSLLWVPGLGVDARCRARPGERQWALSFVPDA